MEQDILSEVIETEKEIQRCLVEERAKARKWLEATKRQIEEERAQAEGILAADLERSLAEAEKEAAARARSVVQEAVRTGENLRGMDDATLRSIVGKWIGRIRPG